MKTYIRYFHGDEIYPVLDSPGRAFFDYWNELRQDRAYPGKSEFDPMRVAAALPGIQIVERENGPVEFRYRLVGTREVEARGWNPTGFSVAEGFAGPTPEIVLKHYRMTVESAKPLCVAGVFLKQSNIWTEVIALFLPMAGAADDLRYVFTYTYLLPVLTR